VLKGVFGYERLDVAHLVAKGRLDRELVRLDALAERRERIDEARARLDEARGHARDAQARAARLDAAAPEIERLDAELAAAASAADDSERERLRVEEIAASLPSTEAVDRTVDEAQGAEGAVADAERARDEALEVRKAADATLADVRAKVGDRDRFRSFERLVEQLEREAETRERLARELDGLRTRHEDARDQTAARRAEVEEAAAALTRAQTEVATAAAAVAQARELLAQAQHAEMAHELRGHLVTGEPCPVCAQTVATVPPKARAPRSAAARTACADAERAEEATRRRQDEAATRLAEAGAQAEAAGAREEAAASALATATTDLATAEAAVAATQNQLTEWLGDGSVDPREALRDAEDRLEEAERTVAEATRALDEARDALDRANRGATAARDELARVANRLAGAWGRLGEDREVQADAADIRTSHARITAEVATRIDASRAAAADADARAGAAATAKAAALAAVGLGPEADLARERARAQAAHASAAAVADELERQVAGANEVEREILAAEHARDLAKRLAEDLKPSRFLGFLLQEERVELAELGSVHLEELTDGAYRFSQDDAFAIVDVNAASTIRKADSLSGGETFLASLALALALAEMVARGGGRLDSFFLDEGFGSLDPEHLDRAMDGIARLVAGDVDRLVVLVSHVEQMRQTLEDLIVLDKDPRTGDTVVVSGTDAGALGVPGPG
jgi:exonuclease SbcC